MTITPADDRSAPVILTPALRAEIAEYTDGVLRARADYRLNPSEFYKAKYCVDCSRTKRTSDVPRCYECKKKNGHGYAA